jgi:tRNA nucleotidyltransferase (CCA-adding enzyme)
MKIYLVGGAVRDKLLGLPIKEHDWVVVGATVEDMLKQGFRQVGKEFPVFLHPKTNEEYALARMERKVNLGYKGFTFDASPEVTLEDDLIDPYHGKEDLDKKILRHVSPAFGEDPVRILRVGRFLARYASLGFHMAPETIELMKKMVAAGEVDALVAERVWKELDRALGEKNPEKFFEVLTQCGALKILFPGHEIDGDGINALKAAAKLTDDPAIRFAAFMHGDIYDPAKAMIINYITFICERYRAPNAYRELAKLTTAYSEAAFLSKKLSPNALIQLFSSLDIFRREQRFHSFVIACQAIADARGQNFDQKWLLDCAEAAKSYDVHELISKGFNGTRLAEKLKEKRTEKITGWLLGK